MYYLYQRKIFVLLFIYLVTASKNNLSADDTHKSQMPLVFRENVGQWEKEILYKGSSSAATIFFTKKGIAVAHSRKLASLIPGRKHELENLCWKINFEGALEQTNVRSTGILASHTNYLIGTEDRHRTNVPDCNELIYESLYKGIDLHYYSSQGELKYDFILSPGARMEDIGLHCEGVQKIEINKNGDLEITHKWGSVLEKKPYSYQEINGKKIEVDIRYQIIKKNTYGYKLYGTYDPTKKLIIDPFSISWGTYIAGNRPTVGDYLYDIAVDAGGATYGTGYYSQAFPTTSGSYDQSYNGGNGDAFVYKLDGSGGNLIYATYIGGNDDDAGMAITVNSNGEAYVAGYTFTPSNGFPTTKQFGSMASSSNVFVCKLSSDGSSLLFSVYMGANDQESALDLALNQSGEIIVVGETNSYNFPMASTTYQNTYRGGIYDGFYVHLDAGGLSMLSSGFLGGSSDDRAKGVTVDQNNNIYITGYTSSANFPVSAGVYDNSYNGGQDVFVMKFDPSVVSLQYATFIGGTYDEEGNDIAVTPKGEAIVTGYTLSNNYPTNDGSSYKGLSDIILTRINGAGSAIVYSKMIGGNNNDVGTSLAVDTFGQAYVVGVTRSTDAGSWAPNIDQGNNVPNIFNGNYNIYLGLFCKDGRLYENHTLGGTDNDYNVPSIGFSDPTKVCEVLIGFSTLSNDLPTTSGVYQQNKPNGNVLNDQLSVFKILISIPSNTTNTSEVVLCVPQTLKLCDTTTIIDLCGDIYQTITCKNYTFSYFNQKVTITDNTYRGCMHTSDVITYNYVDTPKVHIVASAPFFCQGKPLSLVAADTTGFAINLKMPSPYTITLAWSTGAGTDSISVGSPGKYWVRASNVCHSSSDTFAVKEYYPPQLNLGPNRTMCFPVNTILSAATIADSSTTSYLWSPTGQTTPSITVVQGGKYCVMKSNQCGSVDSCITINPSAPPAVKLGNDTSLCNGAAITLNAGNPGSAYLWSPGGQTTQTISVSSVGLYSVVVTNSCGKDSGQINVTQVSAPPTDNLGPDKLLCNPTSFPLTLDAGNPGSKYYWSTGATSKTITVSSGGKYSVLVTNGCGISKDSITITAPPSLGLNLGPDTILCGPATLTLNAGNAGATFQWTPGGQNTQSIAVNSSGNYAVTVTNACSSASDNITITIQNGMPIVNLGMDKAICVGTPTVLNAGNAIGQTYVWSTGATTSSISVTTVGTYWVDVTNKCGTKRDSINLTNGLPSFSLGPDRFVCAPSTVLLSASGASSYSWSTGATSVSINVTTSGIYWVDATNNCGTVRDSVTVSIASGIPIVNLGPDQVHCSSFTTVLDAGNPGATYSWSPGGQTTQSISVNTGGQYSVVATNGCGIGRDTILITTQPSLLALGSTVDICQGSTTILDAGNIGATYVWTPGNQTSQTISVSTTGIYDVTITNACGTISGNIKVNVITGVPTVNLGPDIRLCAPASATLDAGNAGDTYLWSTAATSQTIMVATSGKYFVQVTNACGKASDTINVTVDNGIPLVNLGPDQVVCQPVFLPLNAEARATSYSWNTGASTSTIYVTSSGKYSVTVTNSCGITNDSIFVNVFIPPTISLKDTGGCINPITLDAGNPGDSFLWLPGGQTSEVISVANSGPYTLNISNACGIFSKTVDIVINTGIPVINLGADTNLCTPAGLLLNAGIQPGGTYLWTPGNDTAQTKHVTNAGIYGVNVRNYCGSNSDNITIGANPITVNARFADTICLGKSARLFTDSLPGYTYNWTPIASLKNYNSPSPIATPKSNTTYYINTSNGVCYNIDSVKISVETPENPKIAITPPTKEGYVPLAVTFSDAKNAGVSYLWNFGDGDSSRLTNPKHSFMTENYFTVRLTAYTDKGCPSYDSIVIKAFTLYIPNLITPNGDGKNDNWSLTKLHDQLHVEIYNRWGERVYIKDNYVDEWTGENLADGVYYYIVEDGIYNKSYKGWVEILRGAGQ
jgi:gliding motility-associated-like protein